ncbi:hypothetical protein O0L34_g19126 [Tuta absoluta]|nr:hypothetical protein O0L34_g19126 [Tuta absoluta]
MEKSLTRDEDDEEKEELQKNVKKFFYRPDIVYTCPGIKDCMAVWMNGKKETMQKHYLTMFLREAHAIFIEENPELKIGFSYFCSLRPPNVLLLKNTPAEQCRCKIHENYRMMLTALKTTYSDEFWKRVLCDAAINSVCWQNKCEDCKNLKKLQPPEDSSRIVNWKEWTKNDDNKIKLSLKEISTGELFEKVLEKYEEFRYHVLLKRIQSDAFLKDKRDKNTRILQIDFSMSYSCEYQNEIQSALWARSSVTLFTAAVFFQDNCCSFIIYSDCQHKDKDTVFVFVNHLYDEIMTNSEESSINEVIWSDGPASEFKNKFMVKLTNLLSAKFKKPFTWRYTATSHGKGVIDGIGGNVKRLVKQKSMAQGGVVVQSAQDFANLAATLVPKTKIIFISKAQIEAKIQAEKPWNKVDAIPGISRFHEIACNQGNVVAKRHCLEVEASKFQLKS